MIHELNADQRRRYARHLVLSSLGKAGQEKLLASSLLVIGAGGLGAAALSYLAAAGIGRLGMVDPDKVELSNLGRQIIYETGDIGRWKVDAAADRISELNPEVKVEAYRFAFDAQPATRHSLLTTYDLILDCTDNFPTRFAINEACLREEKPLVSAALRGWQGQVTTFKAHLGAPHPCYRCLVPELPPNRNDCTERGVVSPLVGVLGSMQALEAIKELLGIGQSLSGRLLRFDALSGAWRESRLLRDPACLTCAGTPK